MQKENIQIGVETAEYYKLPYMNVEQTIYAENYLDAIQRYQLYTYNEDRASSTMQPRYSTMLGNDYTEIKIRFGAEESELNRLHTFHDTTNMSWNFQTADGRLQLQSPRNTHWNAYLGKASTTEDGVQYYIVDDEYAVIVGFESETVIESFTLPSEIDGKSVMQVSMYIESYSEEALPLNVKQLTVPSSVKNAMIYMVSQNSEQPLEKIVFEEGVQSIQLCSMQTEEVVIPSTAHYVDLRRPMFGRHAPIETLFVPDQKVTVNGGEHYYTENGMLYSTEGDLVHQFANREKLNLTVNNKARRILRRSITGLAKNITIPANVEYCDVLFNQYTLRYNTSTQGPRLNPSKIVVFLNSQAVLDQWAQLYAKKDYFLEADLVSLIPYTILGDGVSLNTNPSNAEFFTLFLDKCIKVENDVVYTVKEMDISTGAWIDVHKVYSYLTEDYPKDDLSFDPVLQQYYEYLNS